MFLSLIFLFHQFDKLRMCLAKVIRPLSKHKKKKSCGHPIMHVILFSFLVNMIVCDSSLKKMIVCDSIIY